MSCMWAVWCQENRTRRFIYSTPVCHWGENQWPHTSPLSSANWTKMWPTFGPTIAMISKIPLFSMSQNKKLLFENPLQFPRHCATIMSGNCASIYIHHTHSHIQKAQAIRWRSASHSCNENWKTIAGKPWNWIGTLEKAEGQSNLSHTNCITNNDWDENWI